MKKFKPENVKSIFLLALSSLAFYLIISGCLINTENETINEELIYESVQRALNYLKSLQQNNGQIILENYKIFDVWETIQAARAISLWQDKTNLKENTVIQSALTFLKNSETLSGMVLQNSYQQDSYCIETSSEYLQLLAFPEINNAIENKGTAKEKALFVKNKQLSSGAWKYYGTPYYAMVPILKTVDYHKAKNFLLASQREDGGTFPFPYPTYQKKEDIFCTAQILIFLYEFLNKKANT